MVCGHESSVRVKFGRIPGILSRTSGGIPIISDRNRCPTLAGDAGERLIHSAISCQPGGPDQGHFVIGMWISKLEYIVERQRLGMSIRLDQRRCPLVFLLAGKTHRSSRCPQQGRSRPIHESGFFRFHHDLAAMGLALCPPASAQGHPDGAKGQRPPNARPPAGAPTDAASAVDHLTEAFAKVAPFDANNDGQLDATEKNALADAIADGKVQGPAHRTPPAGIAPSAEQIADRRWVWNHGALRNSSASKHRSGGGFRTIYPTCNPKKSDGAGRSEGVISRRGIRREISRVLDSS